MTALTRNHLAGEHSVFRMILDNLPLAVVVKDLDGRTLYANAAAKKVMGEDVTEPPPAPVPTHAANVTTHRFLGVGDEPRVLAVISNPSLPVKDDLAEPFKVLEEVVRSRSGRAGDGG